MESTIAIMMGFSNASLNTGLEVNLKTITMITNLMKTFMNVRRI